MQIKCLIATSLACLLAAWAPSDGVLVFARILGGLAAGMAYPTTLALITALWSGPSRTKSIALWSATGGAISALGPLVSGVLLEHYWWGSAFLMAVPATIISTFFFVIARYSAAIYKKFYALSVRFFGV